MPPLVLLEELEVKFSVKKGSAAKAGMAAMRLRAPAAAATPADRATMPDPESLVKEGIGKD
jgi:hypothetical protein